MSAILTALSLALALVLPSPMPGDSVPSYDQHQAELAAALDAAGDQDGVGELHNRIEEDSPLWDCRTMGNRVCGHRAKARAGAADVGPWPSATARVLQAAGVGR